MKRESPIVEKDGAKGENKQLVFILPEMKVGLNNNMAIVASGYQHMIKHYILTKERRIKAVDLMTWAYWMEDQWQAEGRGLLVVKQKTIGDVFVSTVFLGLDYSFGDSPPVLWETMTFGHPFDRHCQRCAGGLEQAEAMHEEMVNKVKTTLQHAANNKKKGTTT